MKPSPTASGRGETHAEDEYPEPMRIACNEYAYLQLRDEFSLVERGEVEVKGFGTQKLYFLQSELAGF